MACVGFSDNNKTEDDAVSKQSSNKPAMQQPGLNHPEAETGHAPKGRSKRRRSPRREDVQNITRRDFVKHLATAGLALGMPFALASPPPEEGARPRKRRPSAQRTLFFNFSHLGKARNKTQHFLYLGGRKYRLTQVGDAPEVLAKARQTNKFLRNVPDRHITHHLENVQVMGDMTTLAYTTCNEDPDAGTWAMTGVYLMIPTTAIGAAYRHARSLKPRGPLPKSGKRRMYRVPAARAKRDLVEESFLMDTNSHAQTLVGLFPDLLSVEPGSAAIVHTSYIAPDENTQFLGRLLRTMGPAVPAGTTSISGIQPWATLVVVADDTQSPPVPFKKSDGKLNQYIPDWNATIDSHVCTCIGSVHPLVKNDETNLGVDITAYGPSNPIPPSVAAGRLWARRDGIATVDQGALAARADTPTWTFTSQSPETGLQVANPTVTILADGRAQVQFSNNISNWFVRWLGIWVQFLDDNGTPIPVTQLPSDTLGNRSGPYSPDDGDTTDALFAGIIANPTTIFGVPYAPGQENFTVKIPTSAGTLRVLLAGLGQSGSIPADPANITNPGVFLTIFVNYGLTAVFMAAGALGGIQTAGQKVASLVAQGIVGELVAVLGAGYNYQPVPSISVLLNIIKVLIQGLVVGPALTQFVTWLVEQLAEAEIIDSVPVAGQIARGVAAALGGIQLAETSIEVGISPAVYSFDLVLTHNLSITIQPDGNNTGFPQPPLGSTLYYKASYLFDNGTPHTLDAVDVPDPSVGSIPITFSGIPRGGQVNITIGFYFRNSSTPAGQNDFCAAQGSTGLIDNTVDQAPPLAVSQVKAPIGPSTTYVHTKKTTLDSQSQHHWSDAAVAPPYSPPPNSQQPGLGGFNAITVRQGTSNPPQAGYVGYAWVAYSSGVNGCNVNAPGQFGQLANLNTDADNAQSGYATSACGLQTGSRLSYNLLTSNGGNVYLDTSSSRLVIRPITLDPPAFAGVNSNQAFGVLNFEESTRCLLHPSGHLISISQSVHKIESLKLPADPMDDGTAAQYFLARTCAGLGSRPGLINAPTAAAITPDGVILVLEAGNNRLQAFDVHGNALPYFQNLPKGYPPYFLPLDATQNGYSYLDIAVEFSGFIYVLAKDASNNHRLDIYHPQQSGTNPIATTQGVNGAKLAVDFWRNVYTLNYEVLQLPGGGIPEFTEPSVSLWVPSSP